MELGAVLGLIYDLWFAIRIAFMPTFWVVVYQPTLLLQPMKLSRVFMAKLWIPFGDGTNENARETKKQLITPYAFGTILDVGAGHGHTVDYFTEGKVTKYIALEPNVDMHTRLRERANAAGFKESDGTLLILSNGLEDADSIKSSLGDPQGADTIIAVLTLCSIPSPQQTMKAAIEKLLKPGGQLLFYEHVLSDHEDVAWWQRIWTPIWATFFDGCRMDRPTHIWLDGMTNEQETGSMWVEKKIWNKAGEPEKHLFGHKTGRMIKHL